MSTLNRICNAGRLALLIAPLTLAACAHESVTRTGFLQKYESLSPSQADPQTLTYARGSGPIAPPPSRSLRIEDIEVRLSAGQAGTLSAALIRQAKDDYRAALTKAFSDRYRIETAPTAATDLTVRAAITGLKPSNPTLNSVTLLLVGPVSNGGVSTESEVVDVRTGERVAAMATFTNGHLFNGGLGGYFDQLGHVRKAFNDHAEKLRDLTLAAAGPVGTTH